MKFNQKLAIALLVAGISGHAVAMEPEQGHVRNFRDQLEARLKERAEQAKNLPTGQRPQVAVAPALVKQPTQPAPKQATPKVSTPASTPAPKQPVKPAAKPVAKPAPKPAPVKLTPERRKELEERISVLRYILDHYAHALNFKRPNDVEMADARSKAAKLLGYIAELHEPEMVAAGSLRGGNYGRLKAFLS